MFENSESAAVRMLKVQPPRVILSSSQSPRALPGSPGSQFQNGFGYCLSSVYLHYLAARPFLPKKKQQKDNLINLKIQKENPKVVNEIAIEGLCLTEAANCRCWRSKTFPACDGSHDKHNKLTGDNVGPLILKKYNKLMYLPTIKRTLYF
uniref:CDGSH iron-sulfur domain-containing protein 2 n=1 Tax=Phocoena sinus TaxID=42100 RepID=A0A8C9AYW1_PHOSS